MSIIELPERSAFIPSSVASRTGEYVLGDLIGASELGLQLVTGDENALARRVVGAQTSEIRHPAQYLDSGWVILMTGLGFTGTPGEQDVLVQELQAAGIVALGFAVGIVHSHIPESLLQAAQERSFPIFTIPPEVCFRDIVSTVYRNVLSQEIRTAHRLSAMQRYLVDSLSEHDPSQAIVERLHSIIDAQVAILHSSGVVSNASGVIPVADILESVQGRTGSVIRFEFVGSRGLALPLELLESAEPTWLVILSDKSPQLHPLATAAAQIACPLLVAVSRLTHAEVEQRRLARRVILDLLMDPDDRRSTVLASDRARSLGVDFDTGVVAIIVSDPRHRDSAEDLLCSVESALSGSGIPSLLSIRDDCVCIAMPSDRLTVDLRSRLGYLGTARIGSGRTVHDPMEMAQSFTDARLALQHAVRSDSSELVRYEDMNFGTIMLNELAVRRLGPKVEAWLEPLFQNAVLYETVSAYFDNHLDVMKTADALDLHPNSVRYRLRRVEETIGVTLMEPETIAALHVALRVQATVKFLTCEPHRNSSGDALERGRSAIVPAW